MKYLLILALILLTGCNLFSNEKVEDKQELELLWSTSFNSVSDWAPTTMPILVGDEYLIFDARNTLTAIDIENGLIKWETPATTIFRNRTFGESEDLVVTSGFKNITGWDKNNGALKWKVEIPDSLGWNYGELFISTANNKFYLPGFRNFYEVSEDGDLQIRSFDYSTHQSRVVDNILYTGQIKQNRGLVSAYDLETSELLWRFEPENFGYISHAAPIFQENIIYVSFSGAPYGGKAGIFALKANSGEIIWGQDEVTPFNLVIHDSVLFGTGAGSVWAIDKSSGNLLWKTNFIRNGLLPDNIFYYDGYLYITTTKSLMVVKAENGEIIHTLPSESESFSLVTAEAGRIFVQSNKSLKAFAPWGQ